MTEKVALLLLYILALSYGQEQLDCDSTISVTLNRSPHVLVRPYTCPEDKEGYCIGNPTFYGMSTLYGNWNKDPSGYVTRLNSTSAVLQDILGFTGSQASLTYNIVLGDQKRLIDSKKWLRNSTKTLGQINFGFLCGSTDSNSVNLRPKTLFNVASLAKKFYSFVEDSPLLKLKFGEFYYEAVVGYKAYYNTIPTSGNPIKVSVSFQPKYPTFEQLWRAWIQTVFMNNHILGVKDQMVRIILPQFVQGLALDFDFNDILSQRMDTWMLDCARPANRKACKFRVIDDADLSYNSLMWTMGYTGGPKLSYSSVAKIQTHLEKAGFQRLPTCYKDKLLDKSATAVVYCKTDPLTGDCVKTPRHIAYYHPDLLTWTSKLSLGPLIMHDSPNDIKGYGKIVACFSRNPGVDIEGREEVEEVEEIDYKVKEPKFIVSYD